MASKTICQKIRAWPNQYDIMLSDETEIYHITSFWPSVQLWKWRNPIKNCVHSKCFPNHTFLIAEVECLLIHIARNEGFKKDDGRIGKPWHWTLSKRQPFITISSVTCTMTSQNNPTDGILYFLMQFSKQSLLSYENIISSCVSGVLIQYAERRRLYLLGV